jgi:hypothetical protein
VVPAAAAGPSPHAWSGGAAHGGPRRCVSAISGPGAARVVLVAVARPLGGGATVIVGGLPAGRLSAAGGTRAPSGSCWAASGAVAASPAVGRAGSRGWGGSVGSLLAAMRRRGFTGLT